MVEGFVDGLEEKSDLAVEYIELRDKEIEGCIGCFSCWTRTPGECVYEDDMNDLLPTGNSAHVILPKNWIGKKF